MEKISYPIINMPPIARMSALASLLSVDKSKLFEIANSIESYYKPGKLMIKKNGDLRKTHDAKGPLKRIHENIKNRILKKVIYPTYILGGIADPINPRTYKTHAVIHSNKKIIITEDIKDFFPSTDTKTVHNIWQYCFHFAPKIASMLTRLTIYKNMLPQGWKTSSYLANLVFFDKEPQLVLRLEKRGYSYSRYMDDITVSSKHLISNHEKKFIISEAYGMLFSKGYQPKRNKHEILTPRSAMKVTGLIVNRKNPTIPKKERHNIQIMVYQLEKRFTNEKKTLQYDKDWKSLSGKVGRVSSFHFHEGKKLRERMKKIKPV